MYLSIYHYSAFERFYELYTQYRPTTNDELPHALQTATGYINAEFSLPVNFVAENLPQLKVRKQPLSRINLKAKVDLALTSYQQGHHWLSLFCNNFCLVYYCHWTDFISTIF